jgi:type IV secretory pathway VirB9-like protein
MLLKKAAIPFLFFGASFAGAQNVVHQTVHSDQVIPIQTALNHISIIMLPEKIVRVAAGSEAMQIEWHENNVFIKPLQGGQATDLMVWTEHQFSTYELEAPGDVKQMAFVLDESASPIPQVRISNAPTAKPSADEVRSFRDSAINSALLKVTPVDGHDAHPPKNQVSVSIRDAVRDGDSVYVRFAVTNSGAQPYRVLSPQVFEITPEQNANLLPALTNRQISDRSVAQFRSNQTAQIAVEQSNVPEKDLSPGEKAEGVIEIHRKDASKPGVYQFVFGDDSNHAVKATVVL